MNKFHKFHFENWTMMMNLAVMEISANSEFDSYVIYSLVTLTVINRIYHLSNKLPAGKLSSQLQLVHVSEKK